MWCRQEIKPSPTSGPGRARSFLKGATMDHIKSSALLAGRILLSGIFLMSGAMKIVNWSGTAAAMQGEGMPAVPVFLALAIAAEMIGGLAVLLGCYARPAALMLALYLVPVTLTFHHFWTYEGSAREMME